MPWNFPTTLLCNKLGPGLLCGNTFVAKPADTTPFTTLRLAEILVEAGLPPGVLNVVTGTGPEAGEALVTHPLVRKVAFTGSTPTGERVAALAAPGSKRVTLELGGSDPMIICDDADLVRAASAASMGRFYNCGQACLAIKRVFVFESVADEVIEAIVAKARKLRVGAGFRAVQPDRARALGSPAGDPRAPGGRQRRRRRRAARRRCAVSMTRRWRAGTSTRRRSSSNHRGTRRWPGRRCSGPRCRSGACTTSTRRWRGPTTRRSGLAPRCGRPTWGGRERAAAELDCGYTWINSATKVYDELPFGGLKASGVGKEHGSEALDCYTDTKSVVVKRP